MLNEHAKLAAKYFCGKYYDTVSLDSLPHIKSKSQVTAKLNLFDCISQCWL